MNRRDSRNLDRYITGNYGEDQFKNEEDTIDTGTLEITINSTGDFVEISFDQEIKRLVLSKTLAAQLATLIAQHAGLPTIELNPNVAEEQE